MRGHLYILSGPSGAGKGTIREKIFKNVSDLSYSISCTTRKPREGELDGVDYHFISVDEFKHQIAENKFLEWAEVHGNFYGTSRTFIEPLLEKGIDVMLEIDVQGALQVKDKMPEAITVFLAPPSMEILEERLRGRGTNDDADIKLRMKNAETEMGYADKYDYKIMNDDADKASEEFINLINLYRR